MTQPDETDFEARWAKSLAEAGKYVAKGRLTLKQTDGGLRLVSRRPNAFDALVALRVLTIASVVACALYVFIDEAAGNRPEWWLALCLGTLLLSTVAPFHTGVMRVGRKSAFRRVNQALEIRVKNNAVELWIDGRQEPLPRYIAVAETTTDRLFRHWGLIYGVCLVLADGLVVVDRIAPAEEADKLARQLHQALRVNQPQLYCELPKVGQSCMFTLLGIVLFVATLALSVGMSIWARGASALATAAVPILIVGVDLVGQELLLRVGRWAIKDDVWWVLNHGYRADAQIYR